MGADTVRGEFGTNAATDAKPAENRVGKTFVPFLREQPAGTRYGVDTSWIHWVPVRY